MPREYIIGRSLKNDLEVPAEKVEVSGHHARLTVNDAGEWVLEDLDSSTGTFIRDNNGNFHRIFKKKITEDTVIRLGGEGYGSYQFMAHHVACDPNDYSYEFAVLRNLLDRQTAEEAELEKKNRRNTNIIKLAAPLTLALTIIVQYSIPRLKDNYELNMWISRGAMGIAPVLAGFFFGTDFNHGKQLRQRRLKMFRCPKCHKPISDFDINNMQCPICKGC